jgi:hypothetical protein
MEWRMFEEGPQGRAIYVNESGALIINADNAASGYIYSYGPKGYPIMVDGSGALKVAGAVSPAALSAASGYLQGQIDTLSVSVPSGYNTTIAAVTGWTWDAGESLYRADIAHNFNNQFVVVQCYDPSTLDSVEPDHWTLTDTSNVRIWSSTSGSLGISIR